jgi:hypothetical protein
MRFGLCTLEVYQDKVDEPRQHLGVGLSLPRERWVIRAPRER